MLLAAFASVISCATTADLDPPFDDVDGRSVGLWEVGGAAEIHGSRVMLVPPIQYHRGCAWTNVQVPSGDWSLTTKLQIYETDGGGGFGVWIVDKYNADGPIYGGPLEFKGLSITGSVSETRGTGRMMLDFMVMQSGRRDVVNDVEISLLGNFRYNPILLPLSIVR